MADRGRRDDIDRLVVEVKHKEGLRLVQKRTGQSRFATGF